MQSQFLEIFKSYSGKEKNILLSPFCFEIILNLLAQGTKGESHLEFLQLLETNNPEEAYQKLIEKIDTINKISPTSEFEQTNTIYHEDQCIQPVKSYCQKIEENLSLKLKAIPEEYKNEFQFIIESNLDIKAKWEQSFEDVPLKTEYFTLENGEEIETLFISQDHTYGRNKTQYFKTENFQAIQIPMEDGQLCVEIYLPKEINELNNLVQNLTTEKLLKWKDYFKEVNSIEVILPKFNLKKEYDLTQKLKSIGIKNLFDYSWDFSPMLDSLAELKIIKTTQKNYFKLNEIGIEAGSKTRFFGGIMGIAKPEKHILFEAKHPFMYLVRDKNTNSILFIGLFEEPNKNENFSIIHQNSIELEIFENNSSKLSYRIGFLFAAYTLEILANRFNYKNEFIKWHINKLWELIESPIGSEFDEIISQLDWKYLNEKNDLDKILRLGFTKEKKISFDQSLTSAPPQIQYLFFDIFERVISLKSNSEFYQDIPDRLIYSCLVLNIDLNLQIPEYEVFSKYKKLKNDPWGEIILKENIKYFFKPITSPFELTEIQKEKRRQHSILRKLKPLIWDITIRGAIYFQMIGLDKELINKIQSTLGKEIISDIIKVLTEDDKVVFEKMKGIGFVSDQTGWFEASEYFRTREEADNFKNLYPNIAMFAEASASILYDYENKLKGEMSWDSNYSNTVSLLKTFIEKRILLPDITFFEKHKVKNGNSFGDPIPESLKLFSNI